jgi:hypothetical protein
MAADPPYKAIGGLARPRWPLTHPTSWKAIGGLEGNRWVGPALMAADPPYKLSSQSHGCLDFVLQELGRFPVFGAKLAEEFGDPQPQRSIASASEWGKEQWSQGIEAALQKALSDEPDGDVRGRIQNVIDGKPLD